MPISSSILILVLILLILLLLSSPLGSDAVGAMGAVSSVVGSLDQWSAQQVGEYVAALGAAYQPYQERIVHNGISGDIVATLSDQDLKDILLTLEITNMIHQKVISGHLKKLTCTHTAVSSPPAIVPVSKHSDGCQFFPLPHEFQVDEKVNKSPRQIMSKLFEIQGIAVDPTDLDPAVEKIANAVGAGFGDGINKYDCFINYRVASDSDLAEKLFLYLKTKNIHAFLDKKCLKNGEKWKDGFLTGLKNSKCFVAVISRRALDRVRDESDNHTWDNVLLEYETALNIRDVTKNPKYICPLHVGQCEKGVLTKFIDFSPYFYPDSVEPIAKNANLPSVPSTTSLDKKKTGGNKTEEVTNEGKAGDDGFVEGEENEAQENVEDGGEAQEEDYQPPEAPEATDEGEREVTCPRCKLAVVPDSMGELPDGLPWTCDFPAHEGVNSFHTPELYYGCPNTNTCNFAICPACCETIKHSEAAIEAAEVDDHSEKRVDQPLGTRSMYNDAYYCDIETVAFRPNPNLSFANGTLLVVTFNVRGDGSLGPLQDPMSSELLVGHHRVRPHHMTMFIEDYYQKRGELSFNLSADMDDEFMGQYVGFVFGSSGYSKAALSIPGSTYSNACFPHCSNDHVMIMSCFAKQGYQTGYICDLCRRHKNVGFRWFCKKCSADQCFSCVPCQILSPTCAKKDHIMERLTKKPQGYSSVRCDKCKRSRLENDQEFYHCAQGCKYDLCLECASTQVASQME